MTNSTVDLARGGDRAVKLERIRKKVWGWNLRIGLATTVDGIRRVPVSRNFQLARRITRALMATLNTIATESASRKGGRR